MNAYTISFVCLFSAFMGTHSIWMSLVIAPFTVFLASMGGFFDRMDLTGWTMLIAPLICSFAASVAATAWRRAHPPEPDFVPPPRPSRRRRIDKDDGSFSL